MRKEVRSRPFFRLKRDAAIYADGPQAHLVHETLEQNVIAHIIMEALRLKR